MRSAVGLALGCALVLLLAACGSTAPVPGDTVQGYETELAEGNYARACGYLDAGARTALTARLAHRVSCPAAIARCLPYDVTKLKHDQSQLLFATLLVSQHGSRASVGLSGTVVADAIRRVSLRRTPTGWTLTSYGRGFTACHRRHGKTRRRS